MNIYLASPFFNETEINNVKEAANVLRFQGHEVYVPMEHEAREEAKLNPSLFSYETFHMDRKAINNSDAVVVLYYGNYSDSGTAWEAGYAYGIDKPVILVHMSEHQSNLMMHESALANVKGLLNLGLYDFDNLPEIKWDGDLI